MTTPMSGPVRTAADLMTRDVIAVHPGVAVARAVELLTDCHVSALAVIDGHQRLIGVVSTTDILNAEAEQDPGPSRDLLWQETTVADIMTARPLTIAPSTEVREAALQMEYGDVHRLFVEDGGRLVGVISRSDINRAFAAGRVG